MEGAAAGGRRIVVKRTDGLGARLIALTRVWRFAAVVGAEVDMWWPPLSYVFRDSDATDWRPDALFDLAASDLSGLRFVGDGRPPPTPAGRISIETDPRFRDGLRLGLDADALFAQGPVIEAGGQAVLRVRGEGDEAVAAGLAATFARLVPSAPVRAALAQAARSGAEPPYAAVHIRRGDVLLGLLHAIRAGHPRDRLATLIRSAIRRCPPVPLLLDAADADRPGGRVMVFGDDPALVAEARSRLGGRALNQDAAAAGLGPLQRALMDIHLLRDAEAICLGSSAFAQLPASVGRARSIVVAPFGTIDPWIASFEQEVLDAAEVPEAAREPLRAIYRAEWAPMAARSDAAAERSRALAEKAAGRTRPA